VNGYRQGDTRGAPEGRQKDHRKTTRRPQEDHKKVGIKKESRRSQTDTG
jgi:hypothetical protein